MSESFALACTVSLPLAHKVQVLALRGGEIQSARLGNYRQAATVCVPPDGPARSMPTFGVVSHSHFGGKM